VWYGHQPHHVDDGRRDDDACCQHRPRQVIRDVDVHLVVAFGVVDVMVDGVNVEPQRPRRRTCVKHSHTPFVQHAARNNSEYRLRTRKYELNFS